MAPLVVPVSQAVAQQFRPPQMPGQYTSQQADGRFLDQSTQVQYLPSAATPRPQTPMRQTVDGNSPAAGRTYSPPVHIAPGQSSQPVPMGLQDRLSQVLRRKSETPTASPAEARQLTQTPTFASAQFTQTPRLPERRAPQVAGARYAHHQTGDEYQNRQVLQTSMQEPIRDPFGDRTISAPQSVPRQMNRSLELREPAPSSNRLNPKQISILNRGNNQGVDAELPAAPIFVDQQDDFQNRGIEQDNDFSPESEFDFDSQPRAMNPPAQSIAPQKNQGQAQDPERQQDLRNRLDDRMQEIDNDLRKSREQGRNDDTGRKQDRSTRSLLDLEDDSERIGGDAKKRTPLDKSCEEFRNELLDNPIRNIPLDMSPPASDVRSEYKAMARSWTDRSGNVIASGTMTDLRRGYVILDSGQKIAFARLSDADLAAVSESWRVPAHCSVGNRGSVARNWVPQTYTWTASSLCHKPLYFENIQLERYGHSHGPFSQPVHSVAHFFVSLATLPYQTAISPANECEYSLGLFRPGDCAPWLQDPIPISLDGMRRQALVSTGLALIP